MEGWHAKNCANKVGMMYESKGQHIGKAPSLYLFHTAVRHAVISAVHVYDHLSFPIPYCFYAIFWCIFTPLLPFLPSRHLYKNSKQR